jgi:protein-L-isoaspartate(D-aspartate) O-methyltransferase
MTTRLLWPGAAVLALPLALTVAACGGSSSTTTTTQQQPAATAQPAPAGTPATSPAPEATPASTSGAAPAPVMPTGNNALVGPGRSSRPSTAFSFDLNPPTDSKEHYVAWMEEHRNEDPKFLGERWDRYQALLANKDLLNPQTERAFLLTPREEFVRRVSITHSYDNNFLDIGYGVTISGPHAVSRMTSVLDVKKTDKVLEIGTGSGYQSSLLGHLTDHVWSIEIIKPLADRTRSVYDGLIARGYDEYKNVHTKQADGYYGWEENAPFDKIIVTCGIDHIPPDLIKQLADGGVMVIPVGPPGLQHVLKVTKQKAADGTETTTRSDIYNGKIVPFVPFTKLEGNQIVGSHNK